MRRMYRYLALAVVSLPLLGSEGCVADQVLDTIYFAFDIVDVWV